MTITVEIPSERQFAERILGIMGGGRVKNKHDPGRTDGWSTVKFATGGVLAGLA